MWTPVCFEEWWPSLPMRILDISGMLVETGNISVNHEGFYRFDVMV
jgi:hypothetical protein